MKYLPIILLVVFFTAILYLLIERENIPEVIDRTEFFQSKIDSLSTLNKDHIKKIDQLDKLVTEIELQNDSLIEYQSKIYIYYAKEINSIRTVHDSVVYGKFTELLR